MIHNPDPFNTIAEKTIDFLGYCIMLTSGI